jgi:flagellar hook-basal body complex protein FliE
MIPSVPSTIQPVAPLETPRQTAGSDASAADFHRILQSAIQSVEGSAKQAGAMMESFLSGDSQDLHTVALAAQRAGLQLDMFLQVRNKLVQAYQEVMRMQL